MKGKAMQSARSTDASTDASYLFLVRLWRREPADQDSGDKEWEGKVQHVRSGQAHGFDGFTAMVEALQSLLGGLGPANPYGSGDTESHQGE